MEENFISYIVNSIDLAIRMKVMEQFFPVVLFALLYGVVLTFKSADETLRGDESY